MLYVVVIEYSFYEINASSAWFCYEVQQRHRPTRSLAVLSQKKPKYQTLRHSVKRSNLMHGKHTAPRKQNVVWRNVFFTLKIKIYQKYFCSVALHCHLQEKFPTPTAWDRSRATHSRYILSNTLYGNWITDKSYRYGATGPNCTPGWQSTGTLYWLYTVYCTLYTAYCTPTLLSTICEHLRVTLHCVHVEMFVDIMLCQQRKEHKWKTIWTCQVACNIYPAEDRQACIHEGHFTPTKRHRTVNGQSITQYSEKQRQ